MKVKNTCYGWGPRYFDTDKVPRTRRDLLAFLWAGEGAEFALKACDIVKAGAFYCIEFPTRTIATNVRSLSSLTYGDWKQLVLREY